MFTASSGAAERDKAIPSSTLQGKTTARVTWDQRGTSFGAGHDEASVVFVQGGKWFVYNLAAHGQNGLNGLQELTIPLTEFHLFGNTSVRLDPSKPVSNLHSRWWKSGPFTVEITSVLLTGPEGPSPTPTPTQLISPTALPATATPAGTATPSSSASTAAATQTPIASPPSTATATAGTQGVQLLSSPWVFSASSGAAERDKAIPSSTLQGKTTARVTWDQRGTSFGAGHDEASVVFVQGGKWFVYNLAAHGQNGLNGSQDLTIPLTEFHLFGNTSVRLDPGKPVSNLHSRWWKNGPFTVEITSVAVY